MSSHPSPTPPRPAYRFSFQPATDIAPERPSAYVGLVPLALIPILAKQRGFTLIDDGPPSLWFPSPSCTSSERARDLEHRIFGRAYHRQYPGLYVMHTNAAVDESVERVMGSKAVCSAFCHLNKSVERDQAEQVMVNNICALSKGAQKVGCSGIRVWQTRTLQYAAEAWCGR